MTAWPEPPPVAPDQPWMEEAACKGMDTELFFPETPVVIRAAKRVCGGCAVRVECLTFAVEADCRFGVFGGLTHRERNRLLTAGWWPGRDPSVFLTQIGVSV